jgi:hypothetical protein
MRVQFGSASVWSRSLTLIASARGRNSTGDTSTGENPMHVAIRKVISVPVVLIAALSVTSVAASAGTHDSNGLPRFGPGKQYHPEIDPSDFTPNVDNQWFPLTPGTTLTYTGTKDGQAARDVSTVTHKTAIIDGVTTRVVFDQLFLTGQLAERTFDYYAQDDDGNVWYFGEDTVARVDNGNLTDTEGSFRAGVDGAQPGVFMQAHPQIGRRFRQEWYEGHAEDQFRALSRAGHVTVPFGSFRHALKTEETTALEPDVVDNKYYVRGIGEVVETSIAGPVEKLELVDVKGLGASPDHEGEL